jgi:hypothetical protein
VSSISCAVSSAVACSTTLDICACRDTSIAYAMLAAMQLPTRWHFTRCTCCCCCFLQLWGAPLWRTACLGSTPLCLRTGRQAAARHTP